MLNNATLGEESTDTTESSSGTCPRCGAGITGITTRGPSDHRAAPCNCRIPPQTTIAPRRVGQ